MKKEEVSLLIRDGTLWRATSSRKAIENITIPAEVDCLRMACLKLVKVKNIFIENPNIRIEGPQSPFSLEGSVKVCCPGEEPMPANDWLRKHAPEHFTIRKEDVLTANEWFAEDKLLKINNGIRELPENFYAGNASELYFPESFNNFDSLKNIKQVIVQIPLNADVRTIILDESITSLEMKIDPFRKTKVDLVVASEELIEQMQDVLTKRTMERVTFMTHEQFAEYKFDNEQKGGERVSPAEWMVMKETMKEMGLDDVRKKDGDSLSLE